MPSLPYPENTIWYIEVSGHNGLDKATGSAVAIRLQEIDVPQSARNYLITCAHLLQGLVQDASFSSFPPEIRVWQSGKAYSEKFARKASICMSSKAICSGNIPPLQETEAADDWVILDFEYGLRNSVATVVQWANGSRNERSYIILGFAGGEQAFTRDGQDGMVRLNPSVQFPYVSEFDGLLTLSGNQTRPGASGGGVFEASSKVFAGIHRLRDERFPQVQAVSAKKILEELYRLGYEPASSSAQIPSHSGVPPPLNSSIDDVVDPAIWLELVNQSVANRSRDPSHNRTEFLEKIDQLFQGEIDMPTVIDINKYRAAKTANMLDEYRKVKAENMLEAIAEELPRKCNSFVEKSEFFECCQSRDPIVAESRSILEEIENTLTQAKNLFEKFAWQEYLDEFLIPCQAASTAVKKLKEITNSIYNQGARGFNYKDTQASLSCLNFAINKFSNLLRGRNS